MGQFLVMNEMATIIAIVDNDFLNKSDAIVLLEGDGLNRYQHTVELYKQGWADKIVFSGGITDYEYGSFPFSKVIPYILKEGVSTHAIFHEGKSLNTREQATEVIKLAFDNNWERLILVASPEHQYRAYLTFLRVILDTNTNILLYNSPAKKLAWFEETNWGNRYYRLKQEFTRIEKYTQLGHLATFNEFLNYQKWKESLQ